MTDIVERLRSDYRSCGFCRADMQAGADVIVTLRDMVDEICGQREDLEDEIERLRARLDTVRHEAQAATKLVLEHQSKNCHLHGEIERLRAALRAIEKKSRGWERGTSAEINKIAKEALGDN